MTDRWAGAGRDLRAALPGWVVARLVVLGALGLAHIVAGRLDPSMAEVGPRLANGLLAWDGDWYHDIARHGYTALDDESLRFFPMLPLLARALSFLVLGHVGLALILLANVPALLLGALLHRLALRETGDPALARRAAWLVALVPPFFVLVMGYTEPIALSLAVAGFLALRRRRWGWAAAAGLAAGLTRPVGALLVVPAAIEAWRGWREAATRERWLRLVAVVAPAAGVALFLAWVGLRFGDPLRPLSVQSSPGLRGDFAVPVVPLWNAIIDVVGGDLSGNVIHLPWVPVFVALAVVSVRRWPAPYGALAVVTLVAAMSVEFWGSFERYNFGAFPMVLALATVTERPWAERSVLCLGAALMAGYATLAFLDLYVP